MNGVKVARMYEPEDRLIPLMLAAEDAAGRLGDRPDRRPLPPPIDWRKLEDWIRVFTADAGDRMARTPVNMSPGCWYLQEEMELGTTVRKVLRYRGTNVAAKVLYHAAWRFFENRWLNIRYQPITVPRTSTNPVILDEGAVLSEILDGIESVRIQEIGRRTREYLSAGCSAERLMAEMGLSILKDGNGHHLLSSIYMVSEK